jgi:acyl-CoA thioester hydrolase
MSIDSLWQLPSPHIVNWQIDASHIDHYGHVNNVAYISQLENVAWHHSNALGLTIEHYKSLDRAMVIQSHNVRYLLPCHEQDDILCATWITKCNKKLTLPRKFQYICSIRKKTVFEAETVFVCIALSSGRPTRMPKLFEDTYGAACVGVEA